MGELYVGHTLTTNRNVNLNLGGCRSALRFSQGGKDTMQMYGGKLGAMYDPCGPITFGEARKKLRAGTVFTRGIFRQEKPNHK